MTEKPTLRYWHLWAGPDGVSHQNECAMTDFHLASVQVPAAPQWQGRKTTAATTVMFTVLPVGWVGEWHPNPKPQWIVPLSGRWFVESMDGTRTEFGVGEISFGGDQNAREIGGKLGHRSGTVGGGPAVLMLVQFDDMPAPSACQF
ncbi:MAG TPA: hypothetical protein VII49_10695 [Rhizomicrobium sp.]